MHGRRGHTLVPSEKLNQLSECGQSEYERAEITILLPTPNAPLFCVARGHPRSSGDGGAVVRNPSWFLGVAALHPDGQNPGNYPNFSSRWCRVEGFDFQISTLPMLLWGEKRWCGVRADTTPSPSFLKRFRLRGTRRARRPGLASAFRRPFLCASLTATGTPGESLAPSRTAVEHSGPTPKALAFSSPSGFWVSGSVSPMAEEYHYR